MKESPIFIKAYETMVWVFQHTRKFPKEQRFLMAKRMEDGCLDFYERLNQAVKIKRQEPQALAEADRLMANLKLYNRRNCSRGFAFFDTTTANSSRKT